MFIPGGHLHILRLQADSTTAPSIYGVTFAPSLSQTGGGALNVLKCYGEDKLKKVLFDLGLPEDKVNGLMSNLDIHHRAGIYCDIPQEKLDRYSLGEKGFTETLLGHLQSL